MELLFQENKIFSSTASVAPSVDYTVDYIIQHHCGQIYLAACLLTHLSLFSIAYWNWHTNIGIIYSKEITTTANITTTTATTTNKIVNANS